MAPAPPRPRWTRRASRSGLFGHLGFFALAAVVGAAWLYSDFWYPSAARFVPAPVTELASRTIEFATGPTAARRSPSMRPAAPM
jgi:hypothetical protein